MNLKKATAFVAALALSVGMTTGFLDGSAMKVSAKTSGSFIYGDVNDDGIVNVSDVIIVSAYIKGIKWLEGKALKAADVNGDGIVFSDDRDAIANHVKGKKLLNKVTPDGKLSGSVKFKNIFIVYDRSGSDFIKQAKWMADYAYSNNNVEYIYVDTTQEFIDAWNNKFDCAENIHIFVHGEPGILCFRDDDIHYDQIKKLKPHVVKNNIYLYSCYAGARWMGSTVSSEISDRCYGAPVESIGSDGVDYGKGIIDRKPESHQGGDWKMFYSKPNAGKTYTHYDVTVGKEWRLNVHIGPDGTLSSGSGGKF